MISAPDNKFNSLTHVAQLDAEVGQYFGGNSFTFTFDAEQEMFCPDIILLEMLSLLLGKHQDLAGTFGKLIKPVSVTHCVLPFF